MNIYGVIFFKNKSDEKIIYQNFTQKKRIFATSLMVTDVVLDV